MSNTGIKVGVTASVILLGGTIAAFKFFEKIDNELKKIDRSGMLPAGIVFVGGGAYLDNIVESAKKKLRLPACIGSARNVKTVIDKVSQPEFLTALGLVVWSGKGEFGPSNNKNFKNNFDNFFGKARGMFQKIMPK